MVECHGVESGGHHPGIPDFSHFGCLRVDGAEAAERVHGIQVAVVGARKSRDAAPQVGADLSSHTGSEVNGIESVKRRCVKQPETRHGVHLLAAVVVGHVVDEAVDTRDGSHGCDLPRLDVEYHKVIGNLTAAGGVF